MIQIDMKMPSSCGKCYLRYKKGDYKKPIYECCLTGNTIDFTDEVDYESNDCPLKEVPTGKWIKVQEPQNDYYYRCSNCKEYLHADPTDDEIGLYRYCPNCGARMVEPPESKVENGNDI